MSQQSAQFMHQGGVWREGRPSSRPERGIYYATCESLLISPSSLLLLATFQDARTTNMRWRHTSWPSFQLRMATHPGGLNGFKGSQRASCTAVQTLALLALHVTAREDAGKVREPRSHQKIEMAAGARWDCFWF